MPGFDGTGPMGQGPLTGGGRGFCAVPLGRGGYRPYGGRFFGGGRGRGRGFRNWYWATGLPGWARAGYGMRAFGGGVNPYFQELTPKEEVDMLKEEAQVLKQQLEDIQSQIQALEKSKEQQK